MPYKEVFVEPRVFMRYKGKKVYCTYKDGMAGHEHSFWFTLDYEIEGETDDFDVRDIPEYSRDLYFKCKTDREQENYLRSLIRIYLNRMEVSDDQQND